MDKVLFKLHLSK